MIASGDINILPLRATRSSLSPYLARFLAYFVIVLTLSIGVYSTLVKTSWIWLVGLCVVYPLLSHWVSRFFIESRRRLTKGVLLFTDAFICGLCIVALEFNSVFSLQLTLITSVAAMTLGGMRGWGLGVVGLCAGVGLGGMLYGFPEIDTTVPTLKSLILSSVATSIYVTVLAYFTYTQARSLSVTKDALQRREAEASDLSRKLSKYLSPQIWGSIFAGETDVKLQTQRKQLTVFFSDIKGFSDIAEELQPEALTELLNSYFTEMSNIAMKYGGTIDKFVGDAILIFFGDPTSRGHKQDAIACVSMAIEMRKRMKFLQQSWVQQGLTKPLEIRMGINTGYCTVGNFGADSRMDYTIIGKEVNMASRLENVAEVGEILIADTTYTQVRDTIKCQDRGQISVKGFTRPVSIYEVVELRSELGASDSFVEKQLEGFAMYVDVEKIRNYDKEKVLSALEQARQQVEDKLIV